MHLISNTIICDLSINEKNWKLPIEPKSVLGFIWMFQFYLALMLLVWLILKYILQRLLFETVVNNTYIVLWILLTEVMISFTRTYKRSYQAFAHNRYQSQNKTLTYLSSTYNEPVLISFFFSTWIKNSKDLSNQSSRSIPIKEIEDPKDIGDMIESWLNKAKEAGDVRNNITIIEPSSGTPYTKKIIITNLNHDKIRKIEVVVE